MRLPVGFSARLMFAVLLSSLPVHAQSDFDGDFWISKTDAIKLTYVLGFVDGRSDGISAAADAVGTTIKDPRISKLASEVTVGQIVEGVDDFYKDWRNRKVLLRHALEYVEDEAQGKDDSKLLLFMRQLDSAPKK
jgi:hypothetical protein